jgi:hypothetical protein
VFLVSGALLTDEQMGTIDDKADGFLKKPFSIDDLHDFISNGLKVRDIYKELFTLLPDNKKFRMLLRGKVSLKQIKDENGRKRAGQLLEELVNLQDVKKAS